MTTVQLEGERGARRNVQSKGPAEGGKRKQGEERKKASPMQRAKEQRGIKKTAKGGKLHS